MVSQHGFRLTYPTKIFLTSFFFLVDSCFSIFHTKKKKIVEVSHCFCLRRNFQKKMLDPFLKKCQKTKRICTALLPSSYQQFFDYPPCIECLDVRYFLKCQNMFGIFKRNKPGKIGQLRVIVGGEAYEADSSTSVPRTNEYEIFHLMTQEVHLKFAMLLILIFFVAFLSPHFFYQKYCCPIDDVFYQNKLAKRDSDILIV